jgi:hypothetical protein
MVAAAEERAAADTPGIRWSAEASARMQNVPEFVRPMAISGIEKFAKESGHDEITAAVLDEARTRFGM